jgi:hypothetical protein
MPDDILINIYNSLADDEISKLIVNLINLHDIQGDEDFENILEECLDVIKKGR